MVLEIPKVSYRRISILHEYSKTINLAEPIVRFAFLLSILIEFDPDSLKGFLHVGYIIIELNFQILLLKLKIFLNKVDDWQVNLLNWMAF